MTRGWIIQLACLYGPLAGTAVLAWWLRPGKRLATGVLFAFAWNAALLPWLDGLARAAGFWGYRFESLSLGEMPLALYIGWIIAWGIFAPLLSVAIGGRLWVVVGLMVAMDLRVMPEMHPVVELGPKWFIGEILLVACLLVPSLYLAKWTTERKHTGLRCAMLAPAFGGIFLGIPLLVESGTINDVIARWQSFSGASLAAFSIVGFLSAVPGLAALRDLALSGDGTPVPLDPPRRIVTHGIYAFVRNPMQISMTSLLLVESLFLWSPWPAVLAAMGIFYSEGLARWSENKDMSDRFGSGWLVYRKSVRPWWPGWTPRIADSCELWLDTGCGPCSEVARWFESRQPRQLVIRPASDWPGPPLERVTWHHPPSGRCEPGVRGIAMALQHLSLPWAAIGWIAGMPGISHTLQICFDAAGAGKRVSVQQIIPSETER